MENKLPPNAKALRDLQRGDLFYPASKIGKTTPIFKVVGPCEWSRGGTSVRRCIDLAKNEFVNKQSRLIVIKTQTSGSNTHV